MKKRNKLKKLKLPEGIEFSIEIFGNYKIYITDDIKLAHIIFHDILPNKNYPEMHAFCASDENRALIYIYLENHSYIKYHNFISIFSHEVSHVANSIMEEIDSQCDELRSYLVEYIFLKSQSWIEHMLQKLKQK